MTLFDPDTGKLIDPDALKDVQFKPSGFRKPATAVVDGMKRVEIVREDNGRTAGWNDYHGSGRIDATATPEPAVAGASVME